MRSILTKRKKLWIALGLTAPLVSAAVAISCGEANVAEATESPRPASKVLISPRLDELAKVELTGNARMFDVSVPTEVTHVDERNVFSPVGTREAVQVYGALQLKGISDVNTSQMPLRVLRAYLAARPERRIEMRGEAFFLIDEQAPAGVSLTALYEQTFNFTRANYAPHWPEVVPSEAIMLAYAAAPGFELAASARTLVAPVREQLKTFADLGEQNQPLHLELMAWLRQELTSASESTPSDVKWYNPEATKPAGAIGTIVNNVQFSTNRNGPLSVVKPTNILSKTNTPQLFAFFSPQPGYEVTPTVLDVTSQLDLASWRQLISVDPAFNYRQLVLRALNGELVLDTHGMSLPEHTKLEFAFGGKGSWVDLETLKANLMTRDLADLRTLQARLAPVDEHYYLLATDERAFVLDTSTITAMEDNASLKRLLGLIKIDQTRSTGRDNVAWSVVPSFSPVLWQKGVSYLASDLSFAEVKSAAGWTTALPHSVLGTTQQARIYARAAVQPGVLVRGGVIFDLTESSEFDKLLTLVDLKPLTDLFFRMNINYATSRSQKLVWENNNFTVPFTVASAIEEIQYLSGDYTTPEAAQAAEGWMRTLPTSVSYDARQRNLWVRVLARPGYRFGTFLFNLTQTSGIREVRSVFNPTTALELEQSDLTRIIFSAKEGMLNIDESAVRLPSGLHIMYYWSKGAGGMSAMDLINHMTNVTSFDFASVRAVVQALDSERFVINNNRNAHPNTMNISGFLDTTGFFNAADRMRVNVGASRPNAQNVYEFIWDNEPLVPPKWAQHAIPEYLLGVYPTASQARVATEWSTRVPRQFAAIETTPNLWVRVQVQDDWVVNTTARDLTLSTGIKAVFSTINVEAIINQLRSMRVDLRTSTTANLQWLNIVREQPRYLARIEFLVTNIFEQERDRYSNRWMLSLPYELIGGASDTRVLLARLVPMPGYRFSAAEVDLSITSGIREVGLAPVRDRNDEAVTSAFFSDDEE